MILSEGSRLAKLICGQCSILLVVRRSSVFTFAKSNPRQFDLKCRDNKWKLPVLTLDQTAVLLYTALWQLFWVLQSFILVAAPALGSSGAHIQFTNKTLTDLQPMKLFKVMSVTKNFFLIYSLPPLFLRGALLSVDFIHYLDN